MKRLALLAAALLTSTMLFACAQTQPPRLESATCVPSPPPRISDGLREPEIRMSRNGVLETRLRASYGPVQLAGRQVETLNYEGSVPGPTLAVCPGDKLVIHLENDLGGTPSIWMGGSPTEHGVPHTRGQLTNLHTHGLHVSPSGNSDNVFLDFAPGESFRFEIDIPRDHPTGLYWYHPHRHGFVESQVYAGMFGALYVMGGLDEFPGIADIPVRTMAIHSLQLSETAVVPVQLSETPKSPYFVNGQLTPEMRIRPGETQRWQILNTTADAIIRLGLEGHGFRIVATDGITMERAVERETLLIGPGERREVLVTGGAPGVYKFESLGFAQFQDGELPASTVATVRVDDEKVDRSQPPAEGRLPGVGSDLRGKRVDTERQLVFSEREIAGGHFEFLLNGNVFDPNRVDVSMRLDDLEEWTLVNATTEWHTFHIHVNDFQLTGLEVTPVARISQGSRDDFFLGEITQADTVKLPPGGRVTLRMRPTDFTGKFVFHCHMLFHEDRGMMGVAEVVPR